MGNPITWQNVTGPAMGNPAQFMQMATQGVDGAFDKLGAVLKQREEVDKANWDVGKANNTQAFLDQMSQYRTPAEFQAAQQSGALDASRQGFGAQINREAVRNAENGQLAKLQQGVTTGIAYNNAVVADREAADRDAAGVRMALGDIPGAQPYLDRLTRNKAPLVAEGQKQVLEQEKRLRDASNQRHIEAMQPGAVRLQQAQIDETNARAAEKTRGQAVTALLGGYQKQYTDSQAKFTQGVTGIANELNIPVNKAGEPELKGVDGVLAQRFKATIKERLGDPVSSSAFEAGFNADMVKLGVSAKEQVDAREVFGKLFNDGSVVSAADAATLKAGGEKIDARLKAVREDNPFIKPKADDLIKQQGEVLGMITSGVKDGEFWTKSTLKEEAQELMNKGLTYKDVNGKEVTRAVTPAMLKLAYQVGLEGDTSFFNSTNRNAKKFLENMFKDPNNAGLQKKADDYEADPSGSKAKGDLLKTFRDLPGVQNSPRSLVNNLDAHIAAAQERTGKPKSVNKTTASKYSDQTEVALVHKELEGVDLSQMSDKEVTALLDKAVAKVKAELR